MIDFPDYLRARCAAAHAHHARRARREFKKLDYTAHDLLALATPQVQ